MNSSTQRKSGAILSYVSIFVSTLVQLLYTPFLLRSLGQSEYGLYSLASSIIGYLTVLDLGFGNAIIVYTAKYRVQKKYEEEKKLHGMFKVIFIVLGIISAFLGLCLFFCVDNMFSKTMTNFELQKMKIMILILSFNLMFTFSFSIYNSIITAYEKFTFQKIMSIINTLLKPILMTPLLFLGFKSITMCIIITFINILVLLSNYVYCKKKLNINIKFKGFDKILFKTIFSYSIWIFIQIIVDKVNWSADQFILGAISGTIAVSIYSIASTLNQLFINLSTAISGVFLPKMSKMVANNVSPETLTNEMIKVGRIQNYIIFLMCSGLILFGKQFIMLWAGDGFEEAYYIALILIIPVSFALIQNLGLSILQAMNKYKFISIATLITAFFNIILSIVFVEKWGGIGAALGTGISLIVCYIVLINIYFYKSIKIDIIKFWKVIFKQTVPMTIPIILILLVMNIISIKGFLGFIIYGGIYAIIYFLVSYFLVMNKYEKNILDKLLYKLYPKR